MNALILLPEELRDPHRAVLLGERARSFAREQKLELKQTIRLAVLGQFRGLGEIISLDSDRIEIVLSESLEKRSRLPVILFVAVPRPQTVKKVISLAVQCGVTDLYFVRSYHTVASYLQSHSIRESDIQIEGVKALAQVWDSHLPNITVLARMADFFETVVPNHQLAIPGLRLLLAEPQQIGTSALSSLAPMGPNSAAMLGIGPESGWSDSEKRGFERFGFSMIHLDDREYRVETALALLLGQLKAMLICKRSLG